MKLAVQEGMLPGAGLVEKLGNLTKFGYEGVEVGGGGLADRVKEVGAASKATGVPVCSICAGFRGTPLSPDRAVRQQAMEDIKTLLSVGAELGVVDGLIMVPIFGGPQLPDLSPLNTAVELEHALLLKLLDELGEHAAKVKCTLLVEPLNRYETHLLKRLEDAVAVVEKVGNPYVRIMADFFHMSIEERDIPAAIRAAGKHIAHVHLADSTRLLPGYGHTDFRAGFAALKEIGFQGYMAMECGIPGERAVELPKSAGYLRQWM